MDATALNNLIRYKIPESASEEDITNIIESVRNDVVADICKRRPWSFLERKSTGVTLSSGDYQKALPQDFIRMIGVRIYGTSDNVVKPIPSWKPMEYEEAEPDLDDTDKPWRYWIYYDTDTAEYKIELRPKSDGNYTLLLRYQVSLNGSEVNRLPNGLVAFYGIMAVMAKPDEMKYYKTLYEAGIHEMWANDMPDLGDESVFKVDKAVEIYNRYMDSIS